MIQPIHAAFLQFIITITVISITTIITTTTCWAFHILPNSKQQQQQQRYSQKFPFYDSLLHRKKKVVLPPTTTVITPICWAAAGSSGIQEQQNEQEQTHHRHEFWKQIRTDNEIVSHINDCLLNTANQYPIEFHEQQSQEQSSSIQRKQQQQQHEEKEQSTTTTTTVTPITKSSLWKIPTVQVISAEPPLILIHDFISSTMCDDIIQTVLSIEEKEQQQQQQQQEKDDTTSTNTKPTNNNALLQRSRIGTSQNVSHIRTSSNCWLSDSDCTYPSRYITEQVASITGLQPNTMEKLQIAHYYTGQEFRLHTDHQNSFNDVDCKGRLATFLIYLQTPEQGGETWFPGLYDDDHHHNNEINNTIPPLSSTDDTTNNNKRSEHGVASTIPQPPSGVDSSSTTTKTNTDVYIAPRKGSAVFFWNTMEKPGCMNYSPTMYLHVDERLRHAGLPVITGEKWIANRWIHPINIHSGVQGL